MTARYAVFFAPERYSPWHKFGSHWLGRDEHNNSELKQPKFDKIDSAEFALLTEEPRRYGFHATLKAPFRLAHGIDEHFLVTQLESLASTLKPILLSPLCVASLGNFLTLVPTTVPDNLKALAAACVTQLDTFRATLSAVELARRRTTQLDLRETELLAQYGYPYVLERFQMHFTLTGPALPALVQHITETVTPQLAQLNADAPLWLNRLCLFVERAPGEMFRRINEVELRP